MKRVFTSIATAIVLAGFMGITGCDNGGGGDNDADSVATLDTSGVDVDSGVGGTEVSAQEREFEFDGTAVSVSGDMVTIDHEEIGDYKPAGSNQFKLADAEMAQYVEKGQRMNFTVKVTGDQALVVGMESADDDNDDAAGRSDGRNDLDTIGSNKGVDTASRRK